MKKNLVLLALIGFAMFTLCGCGGRSEVEQRKTEITVKGADGTIYESYQECCAAEDFQAAHQYLAKMENSYSYDIFGELEDAKKFVFKQEALYLMSVGDAAAQKRIIYLLKEGDDDNELVSTLIDIAIDDDDESFVKKLANQYTSEVDDESLKNLSKYLTSKPKAENKEYVRTLFENLNKTDVLFDLAVKANDMEFIDKYVSEYLSLQNSSLLNFLANRNEKKYSDMIIGMLMKEERDIDSKPSYGTLRCYIKDGIEQTNTAVGDTYAYKSSVEDFNGKCKTLLGIALENRNQYLAQRVITRIKQSVLIDKKKKEVKDELGYCHFENFYTIKPDNSDINEAQKTYQEAVRSGAFK